MPSFDLSGIRITLPDTMLTPTIRRMLEKGWYENEEAKALKAHLRADDSVLELGGGAGFLATLCARKVGAANVVTVEANPDMLPVIRQNLADNGQAAATVIHGSVFATSDCDTAAFFVPEAFWAATSKTTGATASRRITVPVLLLDDLLKTYRPTVLIVDVEGAEEDYFLSALPLQLRLIVMELHPDRYPPESIRALFMRLAAQDFTYQPKGSHGSVVVFTR